jgi:hypothetical protein
MVKITATIFAGNVLQTVGAATDRAVVKSTRNAACNNGKKGLGTTSQITRPEGPHGFRFYGIS